MKTKNLIQASANVLKITSLAVGDVVKQVETSSYDAGIYYGVVTDMLNDGENAFIQITRYKPGYGDIEAQIKLFKGGDDLNIFPATIAEVKEHLGEAIESLAKNIEKDERALNNKKTALKNAIDFVSQETSKKLSEVSYREMSQVEYKEKKEESLF
jgi:hypothetical protein